MFCVHGLLSTALYDFTSRTYTIPTISTSICLFNPQRSGREPCENTAALTAGERYKLAVYYYL